MRFQALLSDVKVGRSKLNAPLRVAQQAFDKAKFLACFPGLIWMEHLIVDH